MGDIEEGVTQVVFDFRIGDKWIQNGDEWTLAEIRIEGDETYGVWRRVEERVHLLRDVARLWQKA